MSADVIHNGVARMAFISRELIFLIAALSHITMGLAVLFHLYAFESVLRQLLLQVPYADHIFS